jgi:hypothetical protein
MLARIAKLSFALVIISFAFSQSSMVVDVLTPDAEQIRIEKAK